MNRRSLLFIPGNNPAMLQNADIFDADSIIIDLEDAITISEKDSARILVHEFLLNYNLDCKEIILRINAINSDFIHHDLKLLQLNKIDTLLVPKASVFVLRKLDEYLLNLEEKYKLKKVQLIALVETCEGVIELEKIAACNRVSGVMLGGEDLALDLGVNRTTLGKELMYARSKMAFACKYNKIDAIDTPFVSKEDEDYLIQDCYEAKNLGMNAKASIHPNHIEVINEVFSPTLDEINYAKKIVYLYRNQNKGAISVDGKMIDEPVVKRCESILTKAKSFGII